ncbi:hypothetical protein ON010_g16088 [Phytophthora cinnamomi]|nr:hypothetical protein ON010_g16088 [Phytophthora cinnamomi]
MVVPLQAKLAAEKKRVGGRSRNALSAATAWTAEEQDAYNAMLALAQQAAGRDRAWLRVTQEEVDGVVMIGGRPWIPNGAKELLARLFVVAHAGAQGHRGQEPMTIVLQQRFWITCLAEKVVKFSSECLLCKHVKGPRLIPRPHLLVTLRLRISTGLPASSRLDAVVVPANTSGNARVIELDNVAQLEHLRTLLHEIHREAADVKERKRLQDMRSHKGSSVSWRFRTMIKDRPRAAKQQAIGPMAKGWCLASKVFASTASTNSSIGGVVGRPSGHRELMGAPGHDTPRCGQEDPDASGK